MAINKYMLAALKAVSHVEIDLKTNYKLLRQMERIARKSLIIRADRYYDGSGDDYNGCRVPLRIFTPYNNRKSESTTITYPVIIFIHGGGWVTGELDCYEGTCKTIARQTGYLVIAVDYRLAPEHPFPAALEDCYHAVKAIMRPGAPEEIVLMGDSAGGNLSAAVSLYMRDRGEKTVGKQVLIYPVTHNDHTENSPFPSVSECGYEYLLTSKRICDYMDLYCRTEADRQNPYLSPLLSEDLSGQPDTLIITAQYDPLRDEGEEYGRRLIEAGNRVEICRIQEVLHGYFSLPVRFSAVKETYRIIKQFLQEDDPDGGAH